LIPRHVQARIVESLAESRAVALLGPRQAGKSTLVRQIADSSHPAQYLTLDDPATLATALTDPVQFVASMKGPTVIDEVQRAPDLLLPIKMRLDSDNTPGQFLLTGSANLLRLSSVPDTLPGRVEYTRMWPLSQGELHATVPPFVEELFEGRFPRLHDQPVGRQPLAETLAAGGYPEALRRSPRGRTQFFESYVDSLIERDVQEVAEVRAPQNFERVLRLIAARSGAILNVNGMASDLGLARPTVLRQIDILESLFIIRRFDAWHRNLGHRIVKSPKAYVVDSGLLTHLIGANAQRISEDGGVAGAVVESFVAMELLRLAQLSNDRPTLHHYRDHSRREVDIVLERRNGDVCAVEVKAGATLHRSDFAGLRYLRDQLGERFKAGAVVYPGSQTLPFGDRLAAVPVSGLWAGPAAG
jgi:predicted AAA+ superfamily ATPase